MSSKIIFGLIALQVFFSSNVNCLEACGSSWHKYDGNCYKFVDDKKNYYNALASCKDMDANLASVNNSMENQFLNDNFYRYPEARFYGAWIGLKQAPYKYKWSDNSPYQFNFFYEYYPVQDGNCISTSSAYRFKWWDQQCNIKNPFVCKTKTDTNDTCKEGWVNWNKSCYFFSDPSWETDGLQSWSDAESKCQEWGGHLASITSLVENEFIRETLRNKTAESEVENYWIGLRADLDHQWTDGSSFAYEDFQKDEPRGWGSCYLMSLNGWKSNSCYLAALLSKVHFVCKTINADSNCSSSEWIDFNDKCYYFSDQILNWYEAEEYCANQNSHLVSIQSEEENNFVKKNMGDRESIWLGINSYDAKWSDGTPFVYHNFNRNSAALTGLNRQCNYMKTQGDWRGYWCSEAMPYICKKQPKDITIAVVFGAIGFIALVVVVVLIVLKVRRRGNDDNQTRDHMKLSSNEHEKIEKEAGKSTKNGAETA